METIVDVEMTKKSKDEKRKWMENDKKIEKKMEEMEMGRRRRKNK